MNLAVKVLLPVSAAAVVLAGFRPAPAQSPGITNEEPPGITVRGVGHATGRPDVLVVQIGVEAQERKAAEALAKANERAAALIELLKERGVADKDLQTDHLSIYPVYDDRGERISGYRVSNMLTAKLRDLKVAGSIIDAAAASAGDSARIQGVRFAFDDDSALLARARADAVARAKAQAEQMAKVAGVNLGSLRSITELGAQPPVFPLVAQRGADDFGSSVPVPIEPGEQEMTVELTLVYGIAP
ncbi:MAG: SIMPL domain-containing protein [Candidatus Methylomirabilales bacterium]